MIRFPGPSVCTASGPFSVDKRIVPLVPFICKVRPSSRQALRHCGALHDIRGHRCRHPRPGYRRPHGDLQRLLLLILIDLLKTKGQPWIHPDYYVSYVNRKR